MEIVTGYGGKAHITAEDWAELNRGIMGTDSYVFDVGRKFESELVSNNLLKIYDGCGLIQGRQFVIPAGQSDEITIENGTQGEKRIDLIVARYSKNEDTKIETVEIVLIKGVSAETDPQVPEGTNGNIRAGDLTADMPLYEVELDGINVTEVRKVFKMCVTNADLSNSISQLNANSIEEIGQVGVSHYIKYRDGRLEQWGYISISYTDGYGTIKFPVPFTGNKDTDYFLFAQSKYVNTGYPNELLSAQKISLTNAYLYSRQADGKKTETHQVDWMARGRWK